MLELDTDSAGVFLRTADGIRVPDADAASRILLERYLDGLGPTD
jgi:hypothetical protein